MAVEHCHAKYSPPQYAAKTESAQGSTCCLFYRSLVKAKVSELLLIQSQSWDEIPQDRMTKIEANSDSPEVLKGAGCKVIYK